MKRFFVMAGFLFGLLLAAGDVHAQTGTARGRVVDEKGDPVADATVTIESKGVRRKLEVKSNKKGEYTQVGLNGGVYRFTSTKEGLQGTYVEEMVALGDPTVIPDLVLKKGAQAGAAVGGKGLVAEFSAAGALMKEGKLDEAEAGFKALLQKQPGISEAHFNLGLIQSKRKDYPAAQAEFQMAVDLKPDYTDAWIKLAGAYQDGGDRAKALETIKEAESQNSESASVQFNLGVYFINAQQLDEAEAAFKKAQTLDPSNTEVLFHLATIALNKGDTAGAVTLLEKYLASSPKSTQNVSTAQGLIAALKKK
jgi:Flp pilus assembly protein TadD